MVGGSLGRAARTRYEDRTGFGRLGRFRRFARGENGGMYPLEDFRFDARGRRIIGHVNKFVYTGESKVITPIALFFGLVQELCGTDAPGSVAREAMELSRVNIAGLFLAVNRTIASVHDGAAEDYPLGPAAARVLALADRAARERGDAMITPEYLLFAILGLAEGDRVFGQPLALHERRPVQASTVLVNLTELMGPHPLGRDLTAEALSRTEPPVVGRSVEVNRILTILSRRRRNNPIVVGRAGTGRIPIIGAVAHAIAHRAEAPQVLHGKSLFLVDWQREADTPGLFRRARLAGSILCFPDADWFLNPRARDPRDPVISAFWSMVASGDLRVILSLRPDDVDALRAPGSTLDNHFETVAIPEATVAQTVQRLRSVRVAHEKHHRVAIPDELLPEIADLADRHIRHRALPAKATGLLDEAGALARRRDFGPGVVRLTRDDVLAAVAELTGLGVAEIDRVPVVDAADPAGPRVEARLPLIDASVAILVGSSSYEDGRLPEIPAVVRNLADMRLQFQEIFGTVKTFAEPGLTDLGLIREAAMGATDTVLFYFAGYGLRQPDGRLHLALPNSHVDRQSSTGFAYETIRSLIAESPAARKLVLLDCCFSGVATEVLSGTGLDDELLRIEGTQVITATASTRIAHAPGDRRHTGFTGALLDVLREGVDNREKYIRVSEVFDPLRRRMVSDGLHPPRQLATHTIGDLAIAHNPFGR